MAEMSRLSHELHTDKHIVNIEHREMIDASVSAGTSTGTCTHTRAHTQRKLKQASPYAHTHQFIQCIQVVYVCV